MHRSLTILGTLGLVVVLAACSPAAKPSPSSSANPAGSSGKRPATPAEIAAYQGSDRQQMLEDGARQEGKVTW